MEAPAAPSKSARQHLSSILPPLVFGTATLNYQFNIDPYALNPNTLISQAVHSGIRAFDTSPYYGPAEEILGSALQSPLITQSPTLHLQRSDYFLLTKAGRIASDSFDYSASWIRHSVHRSLRRLHTTYLDVVYLHDVEFVSPAEVLTAITELRRLRDHDRVLNYVGICGYPVDVLCELAELILRKTNEPIDIVQSYANFTLQNQRLLTHGLQRLSAAGVDVVPNASPLGMGLLRQQGPPIGAMGNWHPAPDGLRSACAAAARWVEATQAERLEIVAVRFAMETWMRAGAGVGSSGPVPSEVVAVAAAAAAESLSAREKTTLPARLGVSVMGVSTLAELEETLRVYRSVIDGVSDDVGAKAYLEDSSAVNLTPGPDAISDHEWSLQRRQRIRQLAMMIREKIGQDWVDFAWYSPDPEFVNRRKAFGVSSAEKEELHSLDENAAERAGGNTTAIGDGAGDPTIAGVLTPPAEG